MHILVVGRGVDIGPVLMTEVCKNWISIEDKRCFLILSVDCRGDEILHDA